MKTHQFLRLFFSLLRIISKVRIEWPSVFLGSVIFTIQASSASAANLVHEFFLPMPESQIRQTFTALESGVSTTLNSRFSVVVTGDGTVVHYDQWEDGYEIDLRNPAQATTQIWGDGNNANGIPPGFLNDPVGLPSGTVLTLANNVALPRNPATILYDGRDRVAATKALVISRTAYPTTPGSVLADAVEVPATIDYGTSYVSPVGEDIGVNLFQYVAMFVMAGEDNTSVTIDTDGSGPTAGFSIVLNRGESYLVNGGIKKGASVSSSKAVQVDLIRGRIGAQYETDWFSLVPTSQWSASYYTPVGSAPNGNPTYVFVYNPNGAADTINYNTRVGTGSFSVPSKGVYKFTMPANSGASFTSASSQKFFALSVVAAQSGSSQAYDWGFTLLPDDVLTSTIVVGLGIGSVDGTKNGNPVWVTAPQATKIYVDYKGDRVGPLTDPNGSKYDVAYDIAAFESKKIFDPSRDQSAMRVYTLDGTPITGAWGQDPSVAGTGTPYLDAGTTVLPFPVPVIHKSSTLYTDNPPAGVSVNDVLEYTVELDNKGLLPLGNLVVIDAPPVTLSYVPGSTTLDGVPIADGVSGTPFPLDEGGYVIPIILRGGKSTFTYRTTIVGSGSINNVAGAASYGISAQNTVATPGGTVTPPTVNFTDSLGTTVTSYAAGANIYVTVTDATANASTGVVDTITINVKNTTTGDVETITLVETGANTGVFRNTAALPSSVTAGLGQQDGTLNVVPGNSLSATYSNIYGTNATAASSISIPVKTKVLYLNTNTISFTQQLDRTAPTGAVANQTPTLVAGITNVIRGTVGTNGFSVANGTATKTLTIANHRVPGTNSNRLLVVAVSGLQGSTVTNITFASTNLSLLGTIDNGNGSPKTHLEIWAVANPPAATNDIVVTFSGTSNADAVAAAISFYGVDISNGTNSAIGSSFVSAAPSGATAATPDISVSSGDLLLDCIAANATSGSPSAGQTQLWNQKPGNILGGGSYRVIGAGVTSTNMSWINIAGGQQRSAIAAIAIHPTAVTNVTAGVTTSFTQSPNFAQNFTIPAGSTITVTNYLTVVSGTMPATPNISAQLRYGATPIISFSSANYTGTGVSGTNVWSGTVASAVTIPAGQAISWFITNNEPSVTFKVDYGSASKPSRIALPTTKIIHITSLGIYDAPYPGGNLITAPANGSKVYVRSVVMDPFGAYDITSLGLSIDGSGTADDLTTTLTDANVVVSDSSSKTYEYAWQTGATQGGYTISATANEGTEGITDTAATSVTLNFLDNGSPSTAAATSFAANSPFCVRVTDVDENKNPGVAETISAVVTSSSGDSEIIMLTETGVNTGIFAACLPTSTSSGGGNDNGTLNAPLGSLLTLTYTDPDDSSDVSTATAAIPNTVPSLSISNSRIAPASGVALVGDAVSFKIRVVNNGNTTLSAIALTNTFSSSELTFVSASVVPTATSAGQARWANVGPLSSGEFKDIMVNFTAAGSAAPATNTVTAADSVAGVSGTASATVDITNPKLTITSSILSPSGGSADITSNVVFRIVIQNTGDTTISSIPLEDTFSASYFQFVSATVTPNGVGAGSLFWTNVAGVGLAPSGTITIDVTLKVVGAGAAASNTAHVDFANDINSHDVPPVSTSASLTTIAGTIGGSVYNDADKNGAYTVGETGMADVTIELYSDANGDGDPADGAVVGVTTTDSTGAYEFPNLTIGNYVVVETDPAGFASSVPANNRIALNLSSLTASVGNHFFDYIPSPTSYATVGGSVWYDADLNGSFTVGEAGVGSVTVDLVQDANANGFADLGEPAVASTTTAANGSYSFLNVVPGNYVLRETDVFGYASSGDTQGANDNQIGVTLVAGAVSSGNNFFDYYVPAKIEFTQQPTDAVSGATIAPAVKVQLQDGAGNPVNNSGVTITLALSTGSGALSGTISATTDANGVATFSDLSINLAGSKKLTAASVGLPDKTSVAFNITAGPAAKLVFVQQPTDATAGATINPAVTIQLQDATGNNVSSAGVTVSLVLNGTGTLGGTASVVTDASGVATFNNLNVDVVGSKTLTASSAGLTDATSVAFNITAGSAAKIAFVQQPTNAVAGAPIAPAVTVQLQDANGNNVNSAGVMVTIALSSGTGTLGGTLSAITDASGLATYSDLNIDLVGSKNLTSSSAGLTDATSVAFNITAGAATKLAFVQQPTDAVAGATIAPAVTVQLQDANGNNASSAGVTVTIALSSGTGTLSGTLSAITDASGLATFNDLNIDLVGSKNLTASSAGLTDVTSVAFNITAGAAAKLVFVQQPTDAVAGATIAPAVTVQLQDANGNNVSSAGVTVTIALSSGTGTLSGTLSAITDASGLATFNDLNIDLVGSKNLTASSAGLTDVTSVAFNITAGAATKLAFVQQPTDAVAGATIAPAVTVQLQDANGNNVSSAGVTVTLTLSTGNGTLSGTLAATTDASGSATFSDLSIDRSGTKELTASSGLLTPATSSFFDIFVGSPSKLVFVQQPADTLSGNVIFPDVTVQLQDAYGNNVPTPVTPITVTIVLSGGTGTLGGTLSASTDEGGLATFGDLSIDLEGTKELTASGAGVTSAISDPFEITAAAATKLAFVQQPTDSVAGEIIAPAVTVQLQNSAGNSVSSAGVTVTIVLSSGTGSLSGTLSATTDASGLATFNDLNIDLVGSKNLTASSAGLTDATSSAFNITAGAAAGYLFVNQPTNETAGVVFTNQAVIHAVDAYGNYTTNVSALYPGNSSVVITLIGGAGVLSGTTTHDIVTNVPGVITTTDLQENLAGTNWQLVASNTLLGNITSAVFTVISPGTTPTPFGTNSLPSVTFTNGAGPIGLWLADLRGDKFSWYTPSIGLLWRDLVVANYNSNMVTVRLCNDDGTFGEPVTYPTGEKPFAVRSAFISDYVFEDVVVANSGTNTISVFKTARNGTGQLAPRVDYVIGSTPNPGPISIASAFASGAGYADLFIANSNECTVSVLRNLGNGGFALTTNIPVGLHPTSVYVNDIDGDGREDILTANMGDGTLTILKGQSNFTFSLWQTITLVPGGDPQPSYALAGDMDGNGLLDIAVANYNSNSVSILLQSTNHTFAMTDYPVGSNPSCLLLRDLNHDRKLDITVANFGGASVDFMMGNGNGQFENSGRLPVGRNPMCVVGSNFNGDRATDVAVSNFGDDTISIYLYAGPLADEKSVITEQNTPVGIMLSGGILTRAPLSYDLVSQPLHGTLSGTPPNLVYTPSADFIGVDSFQFRTFGTNYSGPDAFQYPTNAGGFNTNFVSSPATVTITVRGVNQAPSFTLATNAIVVPSSADLQTITNFATNISAGANEADQTLKFVVTSSASGFFSVAPTISTNGTLTFKPSLLGVGTNIVSVKLQDNGGIKLGGVNVSPIQQFAIVVSPNQAPGFSMATNRIAVTPFTAVQTIPNFATAITAGAGEVGQVTRFVITVTNASFFAVAPSISTNGTLTLAPAWSATGTNYFSIALKDNGSTSMGGINISSAQVIAVVVTPTPNPFAGGISSIYNGLFYETNGIAHQSSGFATLKVSPKRTFSGKLVIDGNSVAFSGTFNTEATASVRTKTRVKYGKPELTVNLSIDALNGLAKINGTVSDGNWIAPLLADRAPYSALTNRAGQVGSYTLAFPGGANQQGPQGNGFGTIKVDAGGKVKITGIFADNTPVSQSVGISANGDWPFYASLYRGAGSAIGWLKFTNGGPSSIVGDASWIKTGAYGPYFTVGFTNETSVMGSTYAATNGVPVVDLPNGFAEFSGADLVSTVTGSFVLRTNNVFQTLAGLKLSVAASTGKITGSFVNPTTGLSSAMRGVVLQQQQVGLGFFLSTNSVGTFELSR